ncbi:FAS1-like dehydratase domain-containing protein [Dactylosporangium sp. CA-092794]|uniref:FAS1-like dehydratase domain-containing protein n=1 Tax=Dactylosporangium sp. CA-092794 TaxID=3239929 RepID=UPI003D8AD6D7
MPLSSIVDTIRREPARAYRDTFAPDDPAEPDLLPPGWHKLYFTQPVPLDRLRPDGTPAADGIVPDVGLPRRLYAGEELILHRPIRFGETLELATKLGDVQHKQGGSGRLVIVTLESSILAGAEIVTTIRQYDIFLGAPDPGDPPRTPRVTAGPAQRDWVWHTELTLTPVHLFRFSALTFNSHRIHYDPDWTRQVEGQPGLLVHGPLLELLLLDFCARNAPGRTIAHFVMRVVAPTYVDTPVRLVGIPSDTGARLWALDPKGDVLVTGETDWL